MVRVVQHQMEMAEMHGVAAAAVPQKGIVFSSLLRLGRCYRRTKLCVQKATKYDRVCCVGKKESLV